MKMSSGQVGGRQSVLIRCLRITAITLYRVPRTSSGAVASSPSRFAPPVPTEMPAVLTRAAHWRAVDNRQLFRRTVALLGDADRCRIASPSV